MNAASPQLVLASGSPRRRELLDQIGVRFQVMTSGIEERVLIGETPLAYVQRIALDKARAVAALLPAAEHLPVLGADTEVVLDGHVLGKPADRAAGLVMLEALSARSHEVLSAVALVYGNRERVMTSRSTVTFRATTPQERERYWDSGEPADKAGGYAVQGLGAVFIARLDGSYSGVMGLPVFETAVLLREFGIEVV